MAHQILKIMEIQLEKGGSELDQKENKLYLNNRLLSYHFQLIKHGYYKACFLTFFLIKLNMGHDK